MLAAPDLAVAGTLRRALHGGRLQRNRVGHPAWTVNPMASTAVPPTSVRFKVKGDLGSRPEFVSRLFKTSELVQSYGCRHGDYR